MSAEHSFCGMCGKRAAPPDSPSTRALSNVLERALTGPGSRRPVSSAERLLSYSLVLFWRIIYMKSV